MTTWLDTLLFGYYPYLCLTTFFLGSLLLKLDRVANDADDFALMLIGVKGGNDLKAHHGLPGAAD